jgi:PAS domain S-box-containing protein
VNKRRCRLGRSAVDRVLFGQPAAMVGLRPGDAALSSDVACHNNGYTPDYFLSMNIRDFRPVEDIARVDESVRETPEHQDNSDFWRHRLKDGRQIMVEITSHEMVYEGRRARLVCPIDVTLRRRADTALRDREAGLSTGAGAGTAHACDHAVRRLVRAWYTGLQPAECVASPRW